MSKVYHIEDNTNHCIQITIKEYDDESIVHIVLEDVLNVYTQDSKTLIKVEKHTTRDS